MFRRPEGWQSARQCSFDNHQHTAGKTLRVAIISFRSCRTGVRFACLSPESHPNLPWQPAPPSERILVPSSSFGFPSGLSPMNTGLSCSVLVGCVAFVAVASSGRAADQPQWSQAWSRNMVSEEKGLPDSFDPKTGLNIKWVARLGTESYSTPIVSGGHVYIGTNNGEPRDPKHSGDRGVLMCFDEATG